MLDCTMWYESTYNIKVLSNYPDGEMQTKLPPSIPVFIHFYAFVLAIAFLVVVFLSLSFIASNNFEEILVDKETHTHHHFELL